MRHTAAFRCQFPVTACITPSRLSKSTGAGGYSRKRFLPFATDGGSPGLL